MKSAKWTAYNNLHNEDGEGYNPHDYDDMPAIDLSVEHAPIMSAEYRAALDKVMALSAELAKVSAQYIVNVCQPYKPGYEEAVAPL